MLACGPSAPGWMQTALPPYKEYMPGLVRLLSGGGILWAVGRQPSPSGLPRRRRPCVHSPATWANPASPKTVRARPELPANLALGCRHGDMTPAARGSSHPAHLGRAAPKPLAKPCPWTLGKMVQHLARRHEATLAKTSPGLVAVAPPLLPGRWLFERR